MHNDFTYSQIACYKRCPLKWYFKYLRLLQPRTRSKAFEIGSYVHHLLEQFYMLPQEKDMTDVELKEAVFKASTDYYDDKTKDLFEEEIDGVADIRCDAEEITNRYMDKYMVDHEKYSPLWVEKEFAIKIRNPQGRRTRDILRGKFDMGVTDEFDTAWLFEHKTTGISVDNRLETVDLDEQLDLYQMVADTVPDLLPDFGGIVFNIMRKKPPTIPRVLQRPAGSLSKAKDIDTTYDVYMESIRKHGLNPADYAEILGILKEKGDTFFGRKLVQRSQSRINNVRNSLYYTVKRIKDNAKQYEKTNDLNVFNRTPNFMCPRDCEYCELCIMQSKQCDWEGHAMATFDIRETLNPELSGVDLME